MGLVKQFRNSGFDSCAGLPFLIFSLIGFLANCKCMLYMGLVKQSRGPGFDSWAE